MTEFQKIYHNVQVGGRCYIPYREFQWSNTFVKQGTVKAIDGDTITVSYLVWQSELYDRMHGGFKELIEPFDISEVFTFSDDGRKLCEQVFGEKWFDFLCVGCDQYCRADYGYEPNCARCANVQHRKDGFHGYGVCDKAGFEMKVTEEYHMTGAHFCKYFRPNWPQDEPIYGDFETWMKFQKDCEHNTECPHHKHSIWKERPYEYWLNDLVPVGIHTKYNGREICAVKLPRHNRIDMDFYRDGKIICEMVQYVPLKNKNGTLKKGESYNLWHDVPEGYVTLEEYHGDNHGE